jgi:glutamine synthetase
MLFGLDGDLDPGAETTPAFTPPGAERLTHDFLTAVEAFRQSAFIADIFGDRYQKLYGDTKHKEAITHLRTVSDFDYRTYLARL